MKLLVLLAELLEGRVPGEVLQDLRSSVAAQKMKKRDMMR